MNEVAIDYIDIMNLVLTTRDAKYFSDNLMAVLDILETKTTLQNALDQVFSHQQSLDVQNLIKKYQVSETDLVTLKSFFRQLATVIGQVPHISLTLAFAPSKTFLHMISSWILLNIKKPLLIDVTVNASLGGGAIVEFQGNYKDYSLKKKLQELYEQGNIKIHSQL